MTDETHNQARQSWVASANDHAEFPLQNLPFGVFSPPGRTVPDAAPRGGVAIGDMIVDASGNLYQAFFGSSTQGLPPYIFVYKSNTFALSESISAGVGPSAIVIRTF